MGSREAATEKGMLMAAALTAAEVCRPSRAPLNIPVIYLGLTPQAMDLSRLRRSDTLATGGAKQRLVTAYCDERSREAATYT